MIAEVLDRWQEGGPLLWKGLYHRVHQKQLIDHDLLMNPLAWPLMLGHECRTFQMPDVAKRQEFLHDGASHLWAPVRANDIGNNPRLHDAGHQSPIKMSSLEAVESFTFGDFQTATIIAESVHFAPLGFSERALNIDYDINPRQQLPHLLLP